MLGVSLEELKAFETVATTVEVDPASIEPTSFEFTDEVNDNSVSLTCSTNKCGVTYKWAATPIMYRASPQVMYPGMWTSVHVNPRNAPNYKRSNEMPIDIRVDGTSLDHEYIIEDTTTLSKNGYNVLWGTVKNENRNANSDLSVYIRGAGYAYTNPATSKTCLIDGTGCYVTKTVPTVASVSASTGYTSGGLDISVEGTSLNGDSVSVEVDGVPCEVKSTSRTAVICETGEKTLGAA
jgi:hypothetical protein